MTTTETLHHVTTRDLRIGDVVLTHGMRVLLDREPITHHGTSDGSVYAWVGLVTNVTEVAADSLVPVSWLREGPHGQPYPNGEHRWNVQGNHLAHWTVERATADTVAA